MKVVTPVALTTAMLVADSVPETDYPEWAAATAYVANAYVIRTSTHRIYQALVGSTGVAPESDPTKWLNVGPTNRWAMFDQVVGTATSAIGTIDLTIAPGAVNAVAVSETNADTVRVIVTVGDGAAQVTLYDRTMATNPAGVIADWYAYATAPAKKLQTLLFDDVAYYPTARVRVVITGPDPAGAVTVGTLVAGQVSDLGSTESGVEVGLLDFSVKTTDAFGVTTVVQRAFSKRMTAKAMLDAALVDSIQRLLATLRATPVLWIAESGWDAVAIYGFYKDFSIDLALANIAYVSLTIEGLT